MDPGRAGQETCPYGPPAWAMWSCSAKPPAGASPRPTDAPPPYVGRGHALAVAAHRAANLPPSFMRGVARRVGGSYRPRSGRSVFSLCEKTAAGDSQPPYGTAPPLRRGGSFCTSPVGRRTCLPRLRGRWHGVSRDGGSHRPLCGRSVFRKAKNSGGGEPPPYSSLIRHCRARACPRRHGPSGPCRWYHVASRDPMDPGRAGR